MFDLWQKMVNPGAYPLQSLMFPMMDPKELEKKLTELEIVEHWLRANVNMVQLTQKSLQYQLAILKGTAKAQEVLSGKGGEKLAASPEGEIPNPALWAWNMMAEATKNAAGAAAPPKPAPKKKKKS
jgi:hypothetical protein